MSEEDPPDNNDLLEASRIVDNNDRMAGDDDATTASARNHMKLVGSSPPPKNTNRTVRLTTSRSPATKGWDEDKDDDNDDGDDDDDDDDDDFHWKDDWGDVYEETEAPTKTTMNSPKQAVSTAIITAKESTLNSSKTDKLRLEGDDGHFWNDDNGNGEIIEGGSIPRRPASPKRQDLWKELEDYVSSLGCSTRLSSINALLEHEYNTPEKALELVHYYTERPGLAEYTRTKELPRMNYQVAILENDDDDDDGPTSTIEHNQEIIARDFLPDCSIIARSANQSIMADLLQALTGPTRVVRPQFLAMCVAQDCQFRIYHYRDPRPQQGRHDSSRLQVNCTLQLSLPVLADGPRLDIATVHTTTHFSPHEPPVVTFKVDKIVTLLQENDYSKLQQVVDFLMTMDGHMDHIHGFDKDKALQDATPADVFRDAFFLEQSRQLMTQSKAGLKSAWNDVESVMGIQSKLNVVRGGFSNLLPDTNILLEAEEEAMRLAAEREREQGRFKPLVGPNPGGITVPSPIPEQPAPPHPLPNRNATMAHAANDYTARPKSILGELVKSGWGALTNSIAIPDDDDDDSALYGSTTPSHPEEESSGIPTLYRK